MNNFEDEVRIISVRNINTKLEEVKIRHIVRRMTGALSK